MRNFILMGGIVFSSIALDQATKQLATQHLMTSEPLLFLGGSFRLIYSINHGAFLGLGSNLPDGLRNFIFSTLVGVFLIGFCIYALRQKDLSKWQQTAYALVASGGFSNLIDRVTNNGGVVDFMYMGIGWAHTGIFNVADVAIMAGVALLIFFSGKEIKEGQKETKK
ncbi:MAG: signal peptidase II [Pseudomonadota bacterium]